MIPKEIKIISWSFFIIFLSYNGVQQFLTVYFSELNAVKVGFLSLILIYFFLSITNFFSGFIVLKFGAKKCLIIGSIFYSLFAFVLITKIYFLIYLASALLGFGASILWTAQGVLLIRSSDSKSYGRSSGFFTTIFQIGCVLGIIVISILVVRFSFRLSFLIFGTLPLMGSFLFLFLKETEHKKVEFKNGLKSFRKVFMNPLALKFSLIWFSFSMIIASVSGQFPLEVKKYFGLSSLGFIMPIFYFLPIICPYVIGKISDIRGRRLFLIMAFVLVLSGLLLFMLQIQLGLNKIFFILSFIIISFGFAIYNPLSYALLGDISSDGNLEHLTALSLLATDGGYVIIYLLNMYLPVIFSYLIPFMIILSSLIIILPVLKLNMSVVKEKINL